MANKDFLSSLTEETKPESFKEEKRVKVEKPKVKIPGWLIGTVIGAIVLLILILVWLLVIPHIPMEDFTGKTSKDVQSYLTQHKVDPQGIRFEEEYNFDYESGQIISQSIPADKKIKKNSVITFTVSKGADPEETIKVPDLESMTKSEVQKWIENNKLSNTKISTTYSEEVEKDNVISVVFKNDDRDEFKRASTLTINISKGPAPAQEVKVEDFKNKTYTEVEAFTKEKKLKIQKEEVLSTEVEKGLVCYTKPSANEKIKEGETLVVYVSKGKATILPDLVGKTTDDYSIWKMGKGKDVVTYEKYVKTTDKSLDNKIKEQSPTAGTRVTDEVFVVTIYKYEAEEKEIIEYGKANLDELLGMTADQAQTYLNSLGNKGVKIERSSNTNTYSEKYKKGQIIYVEDVDNKLQNNNYKLDISSTLKVTISAGKQYIFNSETMDLPEVITYLVSEGFTVVFAENTNTANCVSYKLFDNVTSAEEDTEQTGSNFTSLEITEGTVIKVYKANTD